MQQNKQSSRSFVIPVLDMSPASPYNIVRLLDDLREIEGDVIIVFNSLEMADKLKDHQRVDYYAVMSENVGVSRAWNIGLNISQTPVTFILNSDLHIEKEAVLVLEEKLLELKDAAIVGPQGSFFDFSTCRDLHYFDKGSFNYPLVVDAVSGFFFAVKTELFNSGTLKFDNQYSPCYYEEWDTALQVKSAGLKSYIVPVTQYDHEWSGSIRALRTIKYLKKEETSDQIHKRNTKFFIDKWKKVRICCPEKESIFISQWAELFVERADKLLQNKMYSEAGKILEQILQVYPENKSALSKLGTIEYYQNNLEKALSYFGRLEKIDPDFQTPRLEGLNLVSGKSPDVITQITKTPDDEKFGEYYENPRPEIQQMINLNSKTILDVGCGNGLMASQLRSKLNAEVWGIELIRSAGSTARKRLDKVLIGKVEDCIANLPDGYFDTIIFADVLEHLTDPGTVLDRIKLKLTPEGEIITSIPNVRFRNVVKNLLSGRWDYEEAGILDNTHMRFFTRSSAVQMFSNAGYFVKDLYSLRVPLPDLPQELLAALTVEGVDVSTLNDESKDFQYLLRAIKKTD